ncbi:MAG: hypothetical protein Kow00108_07060 [Calditrichia bacterium]
MESIKQFHQLLEEQVRLMRNLLKAFKNQQKALVKNDILAIQENTLLQADLIEAIARMQQDFQLVIEKINDEYQVRLPEEPVAALYDKIDSKLAKRIQQLMELKNIYSMEIDEHKRNNSVLLENAIQFVQDHMKLIVHLINQTPVYGKNQKQMRQPVNHLLNKKM